jgi:hypothetical protein
MVSLDWVNGSIAYPDEEGVRITQSNGTEVILKKHDCFYFGSTKKRTAARFTGCAFDGRTSAMFSNFGYANAPQSIMYVTSKKLNGKPPLKGGEIKLKNTKLLDSIKKIEKGKCPHEVPIGWLGGRTRKKRRQ